MNVDEVIAKIGEHMEKLLEEDQDAFGWDIENKVIKDFVEWEKLEKVFNEERIDQMYRYELFDEGNNFDEAKRNAIASSLIYSLRTHTPFEFSDEILEWDPD